MTLKAHSSAGGLWMLAGIVAMLTIPMVIGHFTLASASRAAVTASNQ